MKKLIVLLFFAQFISFTQTAQVKQAADACPGANKNNRTSNEYAYLSKRSAANSTNDFSKPKYQSIYAKNTTSSISARRGKTASVKKNTTLPIVERTEDVVPKESLPTKKEKVPVVTPEKNNSSKPEREPEPEFKTEDPKPVKVENVENVETKNASAPEPAKKEKGKSVSSKKDKKSLETTTDPNSKAKQQKKYRAKKIKCGKGGADDCPQF